MLERLIRYFQSRENVIVGTMANYAASWRQSNPLDAWMQSGSVHAARAATG